MDFYGTAVTAVTQIYQVTVFIQGIVSDIKAFEQDKYNLQLKLELQLASLQFFHQRFLDPQHGLLLPGNLPERIQVAIKHLLEKMKSVLAEYEVLVHRYNVLSDEDDSPAEKDAVEREKWRKKFFEKAKAKAKNLKLKGYDWSLFDREKLIAVVEEYKQWSDSLRDLMQHFSQEAVYSLSDKMSMMSLKGTGLEPVVKRQQLATASAPKSFQALDGDLVDAGAQSDSFQIARWKVGSEEQEVIVEYHEYDSRLKVEDLDSDEIEELKEPVRNLAWLLQNSTFSEDDDPSEDSGQPTIYSLQCLGFIDQAGLERSAFIYKLPLATTTGDETANLITLHGLINKLDPATKRPFGKLPLGDRFNIAHCLALTVLNVHGSRWVHKNIWSRGILLFEKSGDGRLRPLSSSKGQQTQTEDSAIKTQILAFLGDWGYARPEQGGTEMRPDFEIEPNFYRHPDRQGKPTRQFSSKHDMYALGVVLLEIGLWKTVSQFFNKAIQDAQKSGRLPKAKDVRGALASLAQTELPKEMGESYALAVSSSLLGKFKGGSDMGLSLDFKEIVVDAIAQGRKL